MGMVRYIFGMDPALIAQITTPIGFGIAVEQLAVVAGLGNAQPIVFPRNRGKVRDYHNKLI
jgi:hypothetical protein